MSNQEEGGIIRVLPRPTVMVGSGQTIYDTKSDIISLSQNNIQIIAHVWADTHL